MSSRLTDNFGLKAISLLLGVSLWYAVAREGGVELGFSLPIELRNVPEGLEVISESADEVEVRLRGRSELLRALSPQDLSVAVDLSDAEPGERVAYLTPDDVAVPFGARVVRVTPASLEVALDRTLERTVNVIPRVSGSPAEGFELAGIQLQPQSITVVGPASLVRGLDQVTTVPVSAEGLRQPYSRSVRLELDPLVRLARDTKVVLTLDVREVQERKELPEVPVTFEPRATRARLQTSTLQVIVEGPKSLIEPLTEEDLGAVVRLDGLAPGEHSVVPIIQLQRRDALAAIRIVSVSPEEVRVRIQ